MQSEIRDRVIGGFTKALAIIISLVILVKFYYVLVDFMHHPFPEETGLTERAVSHVITLLILLELFILTLQFLVEHMVDPYLIIISVLTVLGKHIIVMTPHEKDYALKLAAIGIVFSIISGLILVRLKHKGDG